MWIMRPPFGLKQFEGASNSMLAVWYALREVDLRGYAYSFDVLTFRHVVPASQSIKAGVRRLVNDHHREFGRTAARDGSDAHATSIEPREELATGGKCDEDATYISAEVLVALRVNCSDQSKRFLYFGEDLLSDGRRLEYSNLNVLNPLHL